MHKIFQIITALIILLFYNTSFSQEFDDFFHEKTLRVDYWHSGNQNTENIELNNLYLYPSWPYAK
jgi:hypothetical protein